MAVTLLTNTAVTPVLAVNAQTGTSYTFTLADGNNTLVTLANAAAIALTIPTNASVALPVGAILNFAQTGAGQVTLSGASGVTVTSTGGTAATPKTRVQYSGATAIQTSANNWLILGDLA